MGYLDLSRQSRVSGQRVPPAPSTRRFPASMPGRFLQLSRAGATAPHETTAPPDEKNERNEISIHRGSRRGRTEAQLWWRLLGLARAIGGESGAEARAALDSAWRQDARLVAMAGQLHIIIGSSGEADPIEQRPAVRLLLDALMRDEGVGRRLLVGDMPPASTVCRPLSRCWSCRSCAWWRRPDGGWVCATCHPAPLDAKTA